jgi:VanZ family protein
LRINWSYFTLAVFWTAFVVYGLSSEPSAVPRFPLLALPGVDKLIHLVLFAIEGTFLALAFSAFRGAILAFIIMGWGVFLGGATELIQHFWVEGRTGNLFDLLADTLGSALAFAIYSRFSKK